MEWDQQHGCLVNGPSAQAEADLQELGRRVAQELDYQPLLADDPRPARLRRRPTVRYRHWRLDGPAGEFHAAVDALERDTVPEGVYRAMQQRHQLQRRPGPLRLLVCGSRTWTDGVLLAHAVEQVVAEHGQDRAGVVLIEGDARGADRLAGALARARGWELETYPADWQRHGRSAGMRRNAWMLRQGRPERVIAFSDDLTGSRGTADMVRRARSAGLPVLVVSHPPTRLEGGEAQASDPAARQLPLP